MTLAPNANLINLLRNGGFEFNEAFPSAWTLVGADDEVGANNTYAVVTQTPAVEHEPKNRIEIEFLANTPVEMYQTFGLEIPFDFEPPLITSADRLNPEGYHSDDRVLLARRPFTFALSLSVGAGLVKVEVVALTHTTDGQVAKEVVVVADSQASGRQWRRYAAVVDPGDGVIRQIGVRLSKINNSASVSVGGFSLAVGEYDALPYLGNPVLEAWPNGAIIFTLGETCPPGFEVVADGAGRFARSSGTGGIPAQEGGNATHSHSETLMPLFSPIVQLTRRVDVPTGLPDRLLGLSGYYQVDTTRGKGPTINADGATLPAALEHVHPISAEEFVPSARNVTLCRRLDRRT